VIPVSVNHKHDGRLVIPVQALLKSDRRVQKERGFAPLLKFLPPLLFKERGI
jgi:hypothetical protein